ncbi:MAG: ThuA domain-containing protein [Candidatus Sumerlaeia bacterium]|nr:ThuA domain-containing protein [Candidatus Sumerlaeia bacterium]
MKGFTSRWAARMLAALVLFAVCAPGQCAEGAKKKILYFTKSQGFQHSAVARKDGQPAYSEKVLAELGKKHGYEIVCSKDGSLLNPDKIGQWDAFIFYATGDLTKPAPEKYGDKEPPMTPEGKQALLDAIKNGKGFMGVHAGNDAFREGYDPFIQMLGGEFHSHGAQQKSWSRIVDKKFPGLEGLEDFEMMEEWYAPTDINPDIHVIILQDTKGMTGKQYERPPYPATWARMHGKGRVFYTSLGHREDVWDNPITHQVILAGLKWILGETQADVSPNLQQVAPQPEQFMAAVGGAAPAAKEPAATPAKDEAKKTGAKKTVRKKTEAKK